MDGGVCDRAIKAAARYDRDFWPNGVIQHSNEYSNRWALKCNWARCALRNGEADIAEGRAHVVISTHALFRKRLVLPPPAFASSMNNIVSSVMQRAALWRKRRRRFASMFW